MIMSVCCSVRGLMLVSSTHVGQPPTPLISSGLCRYLNKHIPLPPTCAYIKINFKNVFDCFTLLIQATIFGTLYVMWWDSVYSLFPLPSLTPYSRTNALPSALQGMALPLPVRADGLQSPKPSCLKKGRPMSQVLSP